jgi:type IV pilus assembly protein PilP
MIKDRKHLMHWLTMASVAGMIAACSNNPTSDLKTYVEQVKNQQKASIEPLPEFEPFQSFTYQANELRDPFTQPVFSHPPAAVAQTGGSGIKPDFDRPTEPLEEYPLDSLRMVGTMERGQETWALILDKDDAIHRVQPGNYMGQNHGKITRITELAVELTEIIPDGLGGWMERQASIAISE